MSRKFCVLPHAFSEEVASNCRRHRHMNEREVGEAESAGEIICCDVGPTKRSRYVEKRASYPLGRGSISADEIRAAAGAYRHSPYEVIRAQRRVEDYAAQWLDIPGVFFTDAQIVWYRFDHEGKPEGEPVRALFSLRSPERRECALAFYEIAFGAHEGKLAMFNAYLRRRQTALRDLERYWREIVLQWKAGTHSQMLLNTRPGRLPFEFLGKMLKVYLHS